jgi:hypothetical protein
MIYFIDFFIVLAKVRISEIGASLVIEMSTVREAYIFALSGT